MLIANNAVYSEGGTAIALISGNTGLVTVAGNVGSGGISGTSEGYTEGNGVADFVDGHYNGAPAHEPLCSESRPSSCASLIPETGPAVCGFIHGFESSRCCSSNSGS